jgi:hypothetical protein
MQSGVLSPENVADVLRGISQRRRQGLLEVNAHERVFVIKFVQGRVVDAAPGGMTGVQDTVAWLKRAGYPVAEPASYREPSYAELLLRLADELSEDFTITTETLKVIVRERVLDHLYNLEVGVGAFYTFKVQMVEHDHDFSPSVSIGQVLLDLVEMNAEREAFHRRFPAGSYIRLTGDTPTGLDPEEEAIVKCIGEGMAVDDLERRALLSGFHFRHAMVQLAGASVIATGGGALSDKSNSLATDLDSFLSSSIDAAFGIDSSAESANASSLAAGTESLGELIDEEMADDEGYAPAGRSAYLQSCSAQLLQNAMIPRLIAIGFSLLAIVSPFLAWAKIVAVFAEM